MLDAHVHLEKGSYCEEWIEEFLSFALERGIDEIFFLEHTHIFQELQSLYDEMSRFNEYQSQWYEKKRKAARPLKDYTDFIEDMRKKRFPVKLRFGLEVCYSPEHEEDIGKIKEMYDFDFLVGSIHFIDGWAFSHLKQPWKKEECDLEKLYQRYYELMERLAKSGLFSGLAHPNSLQCFGAYPPKSYLEEYDKIAAALCENHMYVEESSGLAVNYGDARLGMNRQMMQSMIRHHVPILTASDAHIPQNLGMFIREMNELIEKECRLSPRKGD